MGSQNSRSCNWTLGRIEFKAVRCGCQTNAGVLPEFQAHHAAREPSFNEQQHSHLMTPQASAQGTCSKVHDSVRNPLGLR